MKFSLRRQRIFRGVTGIRVEGTDRAEAVSFHVEGREHRVAAKTVALHEGVVPARQTTRSLGCAAASDDVQRCFRSTLDAWGNTSVEGILAAGEIRSAVRHGCQGPNQAKAFLRAGMGPCQGRMCGTTVGEIIAFERGISVPGIAYFRIRPPLKPITLGRLAEMDVAD